ncbi:MAG TPA: cytochrome c family protein [Geminicoccaceae bacterium]|nr:cytochrome c family protein [Geminicoccaceae bacterium]
MAASLETNKALAALLTAGIIASGSGVISRILYHPSMPEENAYVIAVPEAETGEGEEATAAEAAPLPVLLAAASPEEGETVAKKCAACHSFEQGGAAKIGPPLWGVVGRDVAAVEGFAYSDALLGMEGEWTFDELNAFIHDPKGYAPGTKMAFAGVAEPEDLANLLVYLRSLAEEPVPLPEAAAAEAQAAAGTEAEPAAEAEAQQAAGTEAEPVAAAETQQAASAEAEPGAEAAAAQEGAEAESPQAEASTAQAPDPDELVAAVEEAAPEQAAPEQATPAADAGVGVLLAQADVDAGAKSARKCAACHSFEEGGANKIGPPLWGVIGRDVAALDFAYSDALSEKAGAWDYQALDAFLAEPREWAPGTKMAFAGIREPEERADVILYLRSLSNEPAPLP